MSERNNSSKEKQVYDATNDALESSKQEIDKLLKF